MKVLWKASIIAALSGFCCVAAAEGRIVKVLPQFLDREGRVSLHPSLFERDGYQARLKAHPDLCSGMRFNVQWKARHVRNGVLKLEVRGANTPPRQIETFESKLKQGRLFSRWSGLEVTGPDFTRIGSIIAWRLTLWDGNDLVAEEKSFLW